MPHVPPVALIPSTFWSASNQLMSFPASAGSADAFPVGHIECATRMDRSACAALHSRSRVFSSQHVKVQSFVRACLLVLPAQLRKWHHLLLCNRRMAAREERARRCCSKAGAAPVPNAVASAPIAPVAARAALARSACSSSCPPRQAHQSMLG